MVDGTVVLYNKATDKEGDQSSQEKVMKTTSGDLSAVANKETISEGKEEEKERRSDEEDDEDYSDLHLEQIVLAYYEQIDQDEVLVFYEPTTSSMEPAEFYAEEMNSDRNRNTSDGDGNSSGGTDAWVSWKTDSVKERPRRSVWIRDFSTRNKVSDNNSSNSNSNSEQESSSVRARRSKTEGKQEWLRSSSTAPLEPTIKIDKPSIEDTKAMIKNYFHSPAPKAAAKSPLSPGAKKKKERAVIVEDKEDIAPQSCLDQVLSSLAPSAVNTFTPLEIDVPQLPIEAVPIAQLETVILNSPTANALLSPRQHQMPSEEELRDAVRSRRSMVRDSLTNAILSV